MIIKSTTDVRSDKYWEYAGYGLAIVSIFVLIYLMLRILIPIAISATPDTVSCDAELRQGKYFLSGKNTFSNAETQSSEIARSGQYSSKVDTLNNVGFSYKMRFPKLGERYKVSVWRYKLNLKGGYLVISAPNKNDFYKEEAIAITSKDGWEKLEITFNVPPQNIEYFEIFVTSKQAKTPIYFDDLLIEKLKTPAVINAYNPPLVHLEIGEVWFEALKKRRTDAISTGVLIEDEQEWTKGRIVQKGSSIPLDLRLKGNWLDLFRFGQWAFRVQAKDDYAWNGMQSFTLEAPAAKNYLREWLFHQFLRQEGLIAPRYDFVRVRINNKNEVLYAYEEHFDRPMLEFNQREDAPIVRFSDEAYWLNLRRSAQNTGEKSTLKFIDNLNAAQTQPFQQQLTENDARRTRQFNFAQDLMEQYRYQKRPAHEIFDIEKTAKFYALTDIIQAYQGMMWHNQRFYFNPKTSKLEPIGFDGFGAKVKNFKERPFIGYGVFNPAFEDDGLYVHLFKNEQFIAQYVKYLYEYTDSHRLTNILLNLESSLRQREMFIQRDSASYSFDESDILDNAQQIRAYLIPFNNVSVQGFSEGYEGNGKRISLTNYHQVPLEIIGFGTTAEKMRDKLETPKIMPINLRNRRPDYLNYKVNKDITHVFYRLPDTDSTFHSRIEPWRTAQNFTPEQELFAQAKPVTNALYNVVGKRILFRKGRHRIAAPLVIPAGYIVNIPAGVQLDFIQNGLFLSKSAVNMAGTESEPIRIVSSDNTARGFTVLQTKEKSNLSFVTFENLNTLNYKGWTLTGSVTFYEAEVLIENCTFKNSNAFSALNIVRTNFDVLRTNFSQNKKQGIEAAYSKGTIGQSVFNNIGGSAIDIKSATVELKDLKISNIKENGIIVGERSRVRIAATQVLNATTALVSKDFSTVTVDFIDLKNCQQGFTIFKSRPEFDGSEIIVKNYKEMNIKYLHLIEPGSVLRLRGKVVKGS